MAKITFKDNTNEYSPFYKDDEGDLWIEIDGGWAVLVLDENVIHDYLYFESDEDHNLTPIKGRIIIDV